MTSVGKLLLLRGRTLTDSARVIAITLGIAQILPLFCAFVGLLSSNQIVSAEEVPSTIDPGDISWQPALAKLPPGATRAVISGNPRGTGIVVIQFRLPAGYAIAPHTHPFSQKITVLSGVMEFGIGEVAHLGATSSISPGGSRSVSGGEPHYTYFREETVIEIVTNAPTGLDYVDPNDESRNGQ